MKNRYIDLIQQTFDFPQEGFSVHDNRLFFNEIDLKQLIDKYGTPFRLTYLPRVSQQIARSRKWFNNAIEELNYSGRYYYCYCTKSSHFHHILSEALKNKIHIETSSGFDIDLIWKLYNEGKVDKNTWMICNGYKPERYAQKISNLINSGFKHVIPVLDNKEELRHYEDMIDEPCDIGIRIAAEEEPNFEFYTSRLGIRYNEIIDFYKERIKPNDKFRFRMFHFFINTGIKDTAYYWNELNKAINLYSELKTICPDLNTINIGGGFPIRNSLYFDYEYEYMVKEIVSQIQRGCKSAGVPEPDIFTEFGNYTVGESGAMIFSVLGQKKQNDSESWYMINNSLMTTLPDVWGMGTRFILLPVNKWNNEYQRINIGGLSCDQYDYYNSEVHHNEVYMPRLDNKEPLYIGFFHTGAYQESLSGYGGIKHCLIPSPKHVVLYENEEGELLDELAADEQSPESMLKILGY